ncbi:MAG: hypothetical protein Q9224_006531 [Gallowayella concinna]
MKRDRHSVSCFKKPRLDKPDKPPLRHDFNDGFSQAIELIKIRHETTDTEGAKTISALLDKLLEQFVVDEKPEDDDGDDDAIKRGRYRDATLLLELCKLTTRLRDFRTEGVNATELQKMGSIMLASLKGLSDDDVRYDKFWRSDISMSPLGLLY